MAKHRKCKSKYIGNGKHRVVTPKRDHDRVRKTAMAVPLSITMALYPATMGDGEGGFMGMAPPPAMGEVIIDPTDKPELPPVVDLHSPTH